MIEVSASILNMEKQKQAETIFRLERARIDYFHIDVMDGKFVEKNTYKYMLDISSYIKRVSNIPLDVHLMVQDVKSGIEDFLSMEPNIITFHLEACKNEEEVFEMINLIKKANCRVGISIKPNTPIQEVYKYLPYVHMCLVMTVEPGKGGQNFLYELTDKIEILKKYIEKNNLSVDIEVDGGINLKTHEAVKLAGANILVSGTAILMAKDFKIIVDEFKK